MAHHQADILLSVIIKETSFRTDLPDVFMIFLTVRFLPRTHWVTIINTCADDVVLTAFQCIQVMKLTATVFQNNGKST